MNVVCSLVTVLKPLMTLTRSSSSTYCRRGKKKACKLKLYQTKGDTVPSGFFFSTLTKKKILKQSDK